MLRRKTSFRSNVETSIIANGMIITKFVKLVCGETGCEIKLIIIVIKLLNNLLD